MLFLDTCGQRAHNVPMLQIGFLASFKMRCIVNLYLPQMDNIAEEYIGMCFAHQN